jgi:predicted kinase
MINKLAKLHLLHGFTGSGKTTFAKQLEKDLPAVRFTPDEWMYRLYGENPPIEYFSQYVARIEDQIWDVAEKILLNGGNVILDIGFWGREQRDLYRKRATEIGVPYVFYKMDVDFETCKARVLKRTEEKQVGQLFIDENAINEFRSRFEPMGDDEDYILIK